jgi:hypothetical protein
MANMWFKRYREAKVLPYINTAASWKIPIDAAIKSFNGLGFGVQLVPAKEKKDALIEFVVAAGPMSHPFPGGVAETGPKFKEDGLHGQAAVHLDHRNVIDYAVIFLPGKVMKATKEQKEMVVVHEIIHACGMDEHDSDGIMYDKFRDSGTGVIELAFPSGAKAMPPIRLGATTVSIMQKLWPAAKNS